MTNVNPEMLEFIKYLKTLSFNEREMLKKLMIKSQVDWFLALENPISHQHNSKKNQDEFDRQYSG